jgi:type VI secretion system secreted protein VgrG
LGDFNFETPTTSLLSTINGQVNQGGNQSFEIYDYPGEYDKKDEGDTYARIRIEEEEAPHDISSGSSTCRAMACGFKFEVSELRRRDLNGSYVITSLTHSAHEGGTFETGEDEVAQYTNFFRCIPAAAKFRPLRNTPKPLMQGCQTAIVTGPKGEEIYTDKYGRIKVQFHWDRIGEYNEKTSCWIRVAQDWAGKKWGAMFLPRIGQEVIVDFLEGDPDQPIVTGRVYNASSMPAYTLPDEKTKSYIKSNSSKGGGGFNELRFEDKAGSEQIFIHAQKDKDIRVKEVLKEWIGKDSHLIIKHDQLEKVEGDKHQQVTGDKNEKVGGTVSLKVGTDHHEKVGSKYALDSGTEIHLKAGMNVVIEAGTSITVKAGGNFINIGPSGIAIKGTMVLINSGGAAGSGGGASPETPTDPKVADDAKAGEAEDIHEAKLHFKPASFSPAALILRQAAQSGTPFCDICNE